MKVRMIFITLLLAVLTVNVIPIHHTDPALQYYEDTYNHEVIQVCPNGLKNVKNQFTIGFKKLELPSIGVTYLTPFRTSIYFDPDFWQSATEEERLSTFFHEEGHASLELGHSNNPNNYMQPYNFKISLETLFNQAREDIKTQCK